MAPPIVNFDVMHAVETKIQSALTDIGYVGGCPPDERQALRDAERTLREALVLLTRVATGGRQCE